jgi:hypothetical protein
VIPHHLSFVVLYLILVVIVTFAFLVYILLYNTTLHHIIKMDLIANITNTRFQQAGNYFIKIELSFEGQPSADQAQRTEVAVPASQEPVFQLSTFTFNLPTMISERLEQRSHDSDNDEESIVDSVELAISTFAVDRLPDGSASVTKSGSSVVRVNDLRKLLKTVEDEPLRKTVILKSDEPTHDDTMTSSQAIPDQVGQLDLGLLITRKVKVENVSKDNWILPVAVANGPLDEDTAEQDSYGKLMLMRSLVDLERPVELTETSNDDPSQQQPGGPNSKGMPQLSKPSECTLCLSVAMPQITNATYVQHTISEQRISCSQQSSSRSTYSHFCS